MDDKRVSVKETELIATMSKYVVLVSISLFTTFVSIMIGFIRSYNFRNETTHPKDTGYVYIQYNWLFIDIASNLICFMTQFGFFKIGNDIYYKYCSYINARCQSCVLYCIAKKIKTQRERQKQTLSQTSTTPTSENSSVL